MEVALGQLTGAAYFAVFDAFKGYWQFPVEEDSQELLSFMTDAGVYTPNRIIQGATDAVACFQAGMQDALGELLYQGVLLWIDDLILYGKSPDELMERIHLTLTKLNERGIKLNASRCRFFEREAKWCGRIILENGVRFDDEMIAALKRLPTPTNAAELQQFLCAMG